MAHADSSFNIDQFGLTVLVGGERYCNLYRMYEDDGPLELSCGLLYDTHTSVENVSAQTDDLGDLRCERNALSTSDRSAFACEWRE